MDVPRLPFRKGFQIQHRSGRRIHEKPLVQARDLHLDDGKRVAALEWKFLGGSAGWRDHGAERECSKSGDAEHGGGKQGIEDEGIAHEHTSGQRAYHNKRTFVLICASCYSIFMPRALRSKSHGKRIGKPLNRPVLRRQAKGLRTREAILARAVDIASAQGLEGLTVGSLAEQLGMSKSGLFAHFGSKEELQLATVEMAREVFIDKVTRPAIAAPKGMPRLWSLIDHWLILVEKRVFEGGCFFTAASFEFDGRLGVVRDRIAAIMHEWIGAITRAVQGAQDAGHLDPKLDATRLAFEFHAIAIGAHWAHQLLEDRQAYSRARLMALEKLRSVATPQSPRVP
jgi:AcrR family transcriptional regulator